MYAIFLDALVKKPMSIEVDGFPSKLYLRKTE